MEILAPLDAPATGKQTLLSVRLNVAHPAGALALLTPGSRMVWGNCRFMLNPDPSEVTDYAIVLYSALPVDCFECAPENTLFISGEPPAKKVYPAAYYRQFCRVVDTHTLSGHPRVTVTALGLCWHVGLDHGTVTYRYGYDYLKALAFPVKQNRISVVCSDAALTPGQRLRLEFLRGLKQKLGNRMIHYGRGFEPIADKMEAILPHRFHLALENSESPHYWTEKLTDAYLGWAYPLYVGCPNLSEYFDPKAFVRLDPRDLDTAAAKILALLESAPTTTEYELIAESRRRVLDIYNPFAWCARMVGKYYQPANRTTLTIRSHKAFRPFPQGWLYRWRQRG